MFFLLNCQILPYPIFCLPNSRLWENVTSDLKNGNIDAATDAKSRLEQRQRREAAARLEARQKWNPYHFYEVADLQGADGTNGASGSTNSAATGVPTSYAYKWPLTSRQELDHQQHNATLTEAVDKGEDAVAEEA